MYVGLSVSACVCMHVCTPMHERPVYVLVSAYVFIYLSKCIYTCTCVNTFVMYVHTCVRACMHVYVEGSGQEALH